MRLIYFDVSILGEFFSLTSKYETATGRQKQNGSMKRESKEFECCCGAAAFEEGNSNVSSTSVFRFVELILAHIIVTTNEFSE